MQSLVKAGARALGLPSTAGQVAKFAVDKFIKPGFNIRKYHDVEREDKTKLLGKLARIRNRGHDYHREQRESKPRYKRPKYRVSKYHKHKLHKY